MVKRADGLQRSKGRQALFQIVLEKLHNQLSASFNHAFRYYKLSENSAGMVGNVGGEKKYWTREGETLALTIDDFNFAKKTGSITEPQTPKSNRVVEIPIFLVEEIQ